jgi:hypothetical protein
MDEPYEMRPAEFADSSDFYFASLRAKLLSWAYDELAASKFDMKRNNEWLRDLSNVFLDVAGCDLERASNLAAQIRVDNMPDSEASVSRGAR